MKTRFQIGHEVSGDVREKIRQTLNGHAVSLETREKIRLANLGRKRSPEAIEKTRQAHLGRKNSPETIEKMRLAQMGKIRGTPSLETREKISRSHLGQKRSLKMKEKMRRIARERWDSFPEIRDRMIDGMKRALASPEYRKKLGDMKRGEKSCWWRGGITIKNGGLRKAIQHMFEYCNWRRQVFLRDNWTCQGCGRRGGYLQAHHIRGFQVIIDEFGVANEEQARVCVPLWDVNNGLTMCRACHKDITKNKGESDCDKPCMVAV